VAIHPITGRLFKSFIKAPSLSRISLYTLCTSLFIFSNSHETFIIGSSSIIFAVSEIILSIGAVIFSHIDLKSRASEKFFSISSLSASLIETHTLCDN
jgi:hypothetical protein